MQGDESYRSQEAIEQSLRVFDWKPDEDDPYAMEKVGDRSLLLTRNRVSVRH